MSRKDAFLARAKERLAPLSGDAYTAELAKINAEVDADVAEAVAEERERQKAELGKLQARGARVLRETEAHALVAPIAHPECVPALLPFAVERISVEQGDGDDWRTVYKDANGAPTTREALQEELRNNPALARLIRGASPEEKARHQERVRLALGEAKPNGKGRH